MQSNKFDQYFSGYDNPSLHDNSYSWFPTVGSTVGNLIGQYYGPIGGMIGKAIGRDAGTDFARLASGDEVGKIAWDRIMTMGTTDPVMGQKSMMPFGKILGPLGKSIFGWE